MAKKNTQLNNIWKDRGVLNFLKIDILNCLIWSVVIYAREAWKKMITEKIMQRGSGFTYSMDWQKNKWNVLEELSVKLELMTKIIIRQFRYFLSNRNTKQIWWQQYSRGKLKQKGTEEDRQSRTWQTSLKPAACLWVKWCTWVGIGNSGVKLWTDLGQRPSIPVTPTGDRWGEVIHGMSLFCSTPVFMHCVLCRTEHQSYNSMEFYFEIVTYCTF